MSDVMTSEPLDYNVSSSINTTTTDTGTGSLRGCVSPRNPVIARVTILLIMAVFNLSGNGFTLITIRLTPRLWTKTNFIMASKLISDIMTGLFVFWFTPLQLVMYVFNNPCNYNVVITATTALIRMNGYVSAYHLILISVERYIAIVYPLHYETKFTDRRLKFGISAVWVIGILVGMTWLLWLINANFNSCVLVPGQFYLLEIFTAYIPVCITTFICYGRILAISWRHSRRIAHMNVSSASGSVNRGPSTALTQTQSSNTDCIRTEHNEPAGTRPPTMPAVNSGAASAEIAQQQQQQIKSRRRQFKAVPDCNDRWCVRHSVVS